MRIGSRNTATWAHSVVGAVRTGGGCGGCAEMRAECRRNAMRAPGVSLRNNDVDASTYGGSRGAFRGGRGADGRWVRWVRWVRRNAGGMSGECQGMPAPRIPEIPRPGTGRDAVRCIWVLLLLPWTQGGTHALSAVIHACISPSQRCKLGPVSSEPVELCSKLKLKHKPACELLVRDLVDSRIEPARANKRMRIASHCLH